MNPEAACCPVAETDFRVIAFDCDGVLFDTAAANIAYYNRVLSHLGRPSMTPRQRNYAMMHTVDDTLAHLIPDQDDLNRAERFRQNLSYRPFIRSMKMEPHLLSLMRRLKPRFRTAVVTNRTASLHWVLAEFGIQDRFDLCVTAADVSRPKPHPEPLLKVLRHFGVAPSQVLYVGDSSLDAIAAAAARIPLAAYNNPSLSACYHLDSLQGLLPILALDGR